MDDLISRKELRKAFKESGYFIGPYLHWARLLIDLAPTVLHDNYSMGYQDGVKTVLSEKPQGEWIITGEEQGALGITYKIRKCSECGWEHSLLIPNNFCPKCGAKMKKIKYTELPQYHFDRDDFVRVWQSVLDDSTTLDVVDMCDAHTITDNFEMWRDEDEYYIKYLPNGVIINWYKGTHLGRTNTCTDPNFTLDDFEKFLVQLKHDICGGDKDENSL